MSISTLKILPADFKSYKDQKQQQDFAKPFFFKAMTFFVTWLTVAISELSEDVWSQTSKRVHWNTTHLAWSLSLSNHNLKWSTIEVVAATTSSWFSFLPWMSISTSTHSFHPHHVIDCFYFIDPCPSRQSRTAKWISYYFSWSRMDCFGWYSLHG